MSIAIEASELIEVFQCISTEEVWKIYRTAEFTNLKEELSDVIIYCLSLANQLDIDVATAIEDKMYKNSMKYSIDYKEMI